MAGKKPEIIRKATLEVARVGKNEYGDLIFTDSAGAETKIGAKRAFLYDAFVAGCSTEVGYATYNGHEYIAEATLVDNRPPGAPLGTTVITPMENNASMSKDDWAAKQRIERESIESQVAFKKGLDLLCAYVAAGTEIPKGTTTTGKFIEESVSWGLARLNLAKAIISKVKTEPKQEEIDWN